MHNADQVLQILRSHGVQPNFLAGYVLIARTFAPDGTLCEYHVAPSDQSEAATVTMLDNCRRNVVTETRDKPPV